jgi:hypothetical protein
MYRHVWPNANAGVFADWVGTGGKIDGINFEVDQIDLTIADNVSDPAGLRRTLEIVENIETASDIATGVGVAVDLAFGGPTGEGIAIAAIVGAISNKAIRASFERQLKENGIRSIRKSLRSFQRRLREAESDIVTYKRLGGHTSSIEREVRTFRRSIEELEKIIKKFEGN